MLIDWFTVGAQVLNFIVLVWLMKHFLYGPILAAIDAREEKVAAELTDAAARQDDAAKEREAFEKKNREFDQQRADMLATAATEAADEKTRLLDKAREAADALSAQRADALHLKARDLSEALTARTQQEVFAIARAALTALADANLEERIAAIFTRRLRDLDDEARATLAVGLTSGGEPALVRTAFALPDDQRAVIQHALNETFSADVPLRFATAPALVAGIELTANGVKVAWSIADYLTAVGAGVDEILKASHASVDAAPQTAPAAVVPDAVAAR